MSIREVRRHIGQLLIGSVTGMDLPPELRSVAREFDWGGTSLFARNIESPEQIADLAWALKELGRELPSWVAVDQEGGRVARFRAPFTEWPAMATLGLAGDAALTARFARALAAELRAVGVSLDYAPVLDVHTNPANPVIGDRALSERAEQVGELGAVIIRSLQEGGVLACGKHFPGHGDTSVDSHVSLPLVEHPPDRLRAVELVPFRAAVAAGVGAIMTAHILIPALDETAPATLSRVVLGDLLRGELHFEGLVLSDDLEMGAIREEMEVPDAAVKAVAAGCDGLLVCGGSVELQVAVLEALIHAVESDPMMRRRVDDAIARQRRVKIALVTREGEARSALSPAWRPPSSAELHALVGCAAHQHVAEEMAQYA